MEKEIKKIVRESYAEIAKNDGSSCCGPQSSCCGTGSPDVISKKMGYSDEELKSVPEGANLGLGCGNPIALASLKEGETVVDLGSGAGFDCFLAAQRVGPGGKVIGIDMTPEMISKATENADKSGFDNVEFKLGEIEDLPVPEATADAIISNCVINLSPNKESVFKEAFRVLKPGGRLMISDIVLLKPLPEFVKNHPAAYVSCISGALMKDEYIGLIAKAGFTKVSVLEEVHYDTSWLQEEPISGAVSANFNLSSDEAESLARSVVSLKVSSVKPV